MTHESSRDDVALLPGRSTRRQLLQRAAALGVGASAAGVAGGAPANVVAQAEGSGLLTVSTEVFATWPRNFNPFAATPRWPTLYGIYEPLFIYNTIQSEIRPWLATSWGFSADNLTLRFTTRPNVTWHDGAPFSARDVAFTLNLMMEHPGLQGSARSALRYVQGVEALNDNAVQITFTEGYTVGLYDFGMQNIVPEHIWSTVADPVRERNLTPVGTGPFGPIPVFRDDYYEVRKAPTYWQTGKPAFDGFRFPAYAANDTANLATLNQQTDWSSNFIPNIQETFVDRDQANNHYWFPPTGATIHLYLNTTVPPFENADVRKAISMAIDRELITSVALYAYTTPADSTGLSEAYPAWKNATAADAEWVRLGVEGANALLDRAGLARQDGGTQLRLLAGGRPMRYELSVVAGFTDWVQTAEIIARNLAAVGIEVTVRSYEYGTWLQRAQLGEFTMTIGGSSSGATPFNFYRAVMSSQSLQPMGTASAENWHRFGSPEADALLARFAATSDVAEQQTLANELQLIYEAQAPALPLFPGPQWGACCTLRFDGFPTAERPYALLSCFAPERLLVMMEITPKA